MEEEPEAVGSAKPCWTCMERAAVRLGQPRCWRGDGGGSQRPRASLEAVRQGWPSGHLLGKNACSAGDQDSRHLPPDPARDTGSGPLPVPAAPKRRGEVGTLPDTPSLQMVRWALSPSVSSAEKSGGTWALTAWAGPLPAAQEALACPSQEPSAHTSLLPCPHPPTRLAPTTKVIADSGCPASFGPYSGCAEGPPSCAHGNTP